MRPAGLQRQVIVLLAVAALAMIALAVAGLVFVIGVQGGPEWIAVLLLGPALIGVIFLWQAWALSRDHFIALERLKGAMVSLAGNTSARLPQIRDEAMPEIQGLHAALAALAARYAQERAAHGGAVITIPAEKVEFRAELDADLALHDLPPPPEAFNEDTPLERLPILVLDTETTGLDVARDRVISIGALRLVGGRMYRATSFDRLVNPGTSIAPRSTAIHGITDSMVADAASFAEVYAALEDVRAGTVVVGHQIAFDLAMLREECARNSCSWVEPRSLDTLLLVVSPLPGLSGASLDAPWLASLASASTAAIRPSVTAW